MPAPFAFESAECAETRNAAPVASPATPTTANESPTGSRYHALELSPVSRGCASGESSRTAGSGGGRATTGAGSGGGAGAGADAGAGSGFGANAAHSATFCSTTARFSAGSFIASSFA